MSGNVDTKVLDRKPNASGKEGRKGNMAGQLYVSSFRNRFTGKCEELNDCIFDCSDGRFAGHFDSIYDMSQVPNTR